MERASNRVLSGYIERHHIQPRCLGGLDDTSNIALLTPEEHYLAHQLLCKIYPTHKGLIASAMFLTSNSVNRKSSNKLYGWLKRRFSERMKGKNHPFNSSLEARKANQNYMRSDRNPARQSPRYGDRHHFFGKKQPFEFSPEARQKIAEGKKGENNPYFGQWGWRHSTCTRESREMWKRADEVLELHLQHPNWGYSRISKAMGLDVPHRSIAVLLKIKEGWNPNEDFEWQNLKKEDL